MLLKCSRMGFLLDIMSVDQSIVFFTFRRFLAGKAAVASRDARGGAWMARENELFAAPCRLCGSPGMSDV